MKQTKTIPTPAPESENKEEEVERTVQTEERKPLNQSDLKSATSDFIRENKVGPVIENSLKNSFKIDGDLITIELTNPVEVDGIEKIRGDFLNFIRKEFDNKAIQLQHKVNVEKIAHRPYTAKDKFEAMLKENPILGKLRDTFGLDTDY